MRKPGAHAPRAFRLDDPNIVASPPEKLTREAAEGRRRRHAGDDEAVFELARTLATSGRSRAAPSPIARRRPFGWASMFWGALSGLFTLWLVTAIEGFVADLLLRNPRAGLDRAGFAVLAVLALLALLTRGGPQHPARRRASRR